MSNKNYPKILCEAAEEYSVSAVLSLFGNNLRVRIPMDAEFQAVSVEELDLSARAKNGMMRSQAVNVGKVADLIMDEKDGKKAIEDIKNLGKKSIAEIKTTLLEEGYARLTDDERIAFWKAFIEDNDIPAESESTTPRQKPGESAA